MNANFGCIMGAPFATPRGEFDTGPEADEWFADAAAEYEREMKRIEDEEKNKQILSYAIPVGAAALAFSLFQ